MKYLHIDFEDEHYWLEIGDESYALRQLVIEDNGLCHLSCLEDCLAEGIINEKEFDGEVYLITQNEFDNMWDTATMEKRKFWDILKKKYPIGKRVKGKTLYSYPQGWILSIGQLIGICQDVCNLQPNTSFKGQIIGYDEVNMWAIVSIDI